MPDTRFDVVGVGANAVDEVYRLPAYPTPDGAGSKLRILDRRRLPGGQTATALATCAAAGLRAAYVGAVGGDDAGRLVRSALDARGVDTRFLLTREAPTAYAVILLDEARGERIVLWDRDPRLALAAGELPADALARARLVHVDDVDEDTALAAARTAARHGVPVTSDIERVGARTAELLDTVTVAVFAEHVPQALTGEADLPAALRALRRRHGCLLCATRGAGGALLLDGDRLHEAAAPVVAVRDTTGAGDVFRGALIAAWLAGADPGRMLTAAVEAASLSCTRDGAMGGVPTPEELAALLGAR